MGSWRELDKHRPAGNRDRAHPDITCYSNLDWIGGVEGWLHVISYDFEAGGRFNADWKYCDEVSRKSGWRLTASAPLATAKSKVT